MVDNSATIGLQLNQIFKQTCTQDRLEVLRKTIVSCVKKFAISSYSIAHEPILVISLEEDSVQRSVIDVIEWFLFGEDPIQGKLKLSELNNPPTLCGKTFKNSEPTYSCRDCAVDGTCVLCMTCFGKSIHKDHNYQLNTSPGGGCCDCGDVEAWKQGASCEIHSGKSKDSADEDLLKKLPEDFSERAKCLFTVLLDFCVQLLCEPNEEEILTDVTQPDDQNTHVTMLYNDESHTFPGVISALEKSVPGCTRKLGNDFATIVDREGRSSVFVGSLQHCNQVCTSVQKCTDGVVGPLRCETTHIYTISCQLMALRLMRWLSDMSEESDCLRRLHSILCTTSNHGHFSHLTRILQADAKLWKVARIHSHLLFMNMLLKDSFGKVALGIEFVKNYPIILNDFYADDQDHSISAAGMSVQLFTVPSLAQMLTVNYDLMEIVMGVLLDKTRGFMTDEGVLDFIRDERGKSVRLYWIIHDLRYIFQHKPNEWSENLKVKFYRFLDLFLSMLRRFQGMGLMKRATGIHVEIEPEWHRNHNFEVRLTGLMSFITAWCDSERDILLKSIEITVNCLKDVRKGQGSTKLKKYHEGKKTLKIFDFDVSCEKISMHIPILRFLAGLIGCCQNHSINIPNVLEIKKEDDTLMYMEYPLKVLVFVAQVKAGMWRRNGYSVLHQVHTYRKESSVTELYDKDIFLMQVLASFMDKDYFLHVVLDMFKLLPWSLSGYNVDELDETTLNQQLSLAGEFLHLLIILIGERYNKDVGQVDSDSELRREIIHRLCLGNMSRSELMRGLPLSESEYLRLGKIDDVIASVATFKKPGLSSKGLYKIKKECLVEFNPYFYHYDNNEQSKAEDQQRKRLKEEEMAAVFTPPVPAEFLPTFSSIIDLLTCKKMIEMLTVVLWRIKHGNPKSWTDRMFHEVLHLIGLALHEETRQRNKEKLFGFVNAATKPRRHIPKHYSLFQCLEALQGSPIVESHSGLLAWTIQKFNEEQSAQSDSGIPSTESSQPMDVSDTVLLDQEKLEKRRLARERQERILLQMSNMQKAFILQNSELYFSTKTDLDDPEFDEADSGVVASSEHVAVIAIGNDRTPSVTVPREQFICILCQETPTSNERPLVYSSYIQRSTLLSSNHELTLEQGDKADPLMAYRDHRVGTHVGSCGHVMHGDCWQRFFESILANDRLSLRFRMRNSFDLIKREFLCPLCSGLGNTVLPMVSPTVPGDEDRKSKYLSWSVTFRKIESKITKDLVEFSQNKEPEDNLFKKMIRLKKTLLPFLFGRELSNDMQSMISVFTRAAYTFGLDVQPDDDNHRVPLMVWATCAYTIQCFEHSSREELGGVANRFPKREVDVVKSLVYLANSLSSIAKSHDIISHCLRLIAVLTGSKKLAAEQRSMMEIDLFDWMVKMRLSLPSIECPKDSSTSPAAEEEVDSLTSVEVDGFVFHLALAASIIQVLLTISDDIPSDEMDDCDGKDSDVAKEIANLWGTLRQLCNPNIQNSSHPNPQRLLLHVRYRLLPFLRCCAIFFHILNSTRIPLALRENFVSLDKEYEALAEFLALPQNLTEIFTWNDLQKTFTDEVVSTIVKKWCTNVHIEDASQNPMSSILAQNSLIKLPHDYSELISQASQYDCPVISGDEHRIPAVCLICGKWLCCEAWCCKQIIGDQSVGSCTAHALACGAGVGIFFRVRDCLVLLLNGIGKGCFTPSPYLDAYGETDQGLRRGNPLYLCEERYQRLQKLWKQHGIASEIVRHLETNRHLMQVDWTNY